MGWVGTPIMLEIAFKKIVMAEIQTPIPCFVNGETIYFSPSEAYGKALQRIRNPIPEDEWVTVDTEHDIDIEAVRQRIKQRGIKTKVSAED